MTAPHGAAVRRLAILVAFELRGLLRDRKTVTLTVLVPLLVIPLLVFGSRRIEEQRDAEDKARVLGYAVARGDAAWLEETLSDGQRVLAEEERPQLRSLAPSDPEVDVTVAIDIDAGDPIPTIELAYRGNVHAANLAMEAMKRVLEAAQRGRVAAALREAGFPGDPEAFVVVTTRDVASQTHQSGARLGAWLTPVVVMLLVFGGQLAALDSLAGERERGTLETLLTTAVRRGDVVLGKLLTVFVVALVNAGMSLLALFVYARAGVVQGTEDVVLALTPEALLWLAVLWGALAWCVAAVLLAVSAIARTYKEAQLYVGGAMLALSALAAASLFSGLRWQVAFALVPILNVSLASRELLAGRTDLLLLALTVATNLAAGVVIARAIVDALQEEGAILGHLEVGTLRGEAALRRLTPAAVASTWAIVVLASLLWPLADLRVQLLVNVVGLMFGGSLLLARRHGVSLRVVWGLRWPNPRAFLGVLIGVPSGLVVVQGVATLLGRVIPMSTRMREELEALLVHNDLPAWQQVLWLAVLPGICEELYFRGFVMFGLRDRLRPVARCIVVAAIFGAFHVALVRLLPTAILGVFLGATRLLAGSTFPAILWHALHNGLAVGWMIWGDESVVIPGWGYALGGAGMVVAFGLLRRFGRST